MDENQGNEVINNTPPLEGAQPSEPIIGGTAPESPTPQPEPSAAPVDGPKLDETILNPAPKEPGPDEPRRKPTLSVQAELETPVEVPPAQMNPLSAKELDPKKRQKITLIALIVIFVLALAGFAVWYFLLNNEGKPATPVSKYQQEAVPALEPVETSKLVLHDNKLSDFDLAFLRLENKTENIVYSPLSMKYALAMLQEGANGQSKEQIDAVLGDYKPKAYLNSANRSLANAMFIRDSFKDKILPSYTNTLTTKYNAGVVFDPFTDATPINKWVGDKTLGIINHLVDTKDIEDLDFVLINALAIDMSWKNRFQCAAWEDTSIPCKIYSVSYAHENYKVDSVYELNFQRQRFSFNNHENTQYLELGLSANKYDIVGELGEAKIRETVENAYQKMVEEARAKAEADGWEFDETYFPETAEEYFKIAYGSQSGLSQYIDDLKANYQKLDSSTDFYFLDTDSEIVLAKDLQEYDGSTLQYVGIMPKTGNLNTYLNNLSAEKASTLISSLKDASDLNSFKDKVITKITGKIPVFKYSYEMKKFKDNLISLGITDVFKQGVADLSNIISNSERKEYINSAIHTADIDFSNDGIKAAAASSFGGAGAAGPWDYKFDVPVEEIDLTFDKPFLFLIRDKDTGEVWFVGTVYDGVTN